MFLTLDHAGETWRFDLSCPLDLSIPLDFHQEQPCAFFLSPASASPVEIGTFVGDTRCGGGANCYDVTLNPHGNGTHTECRGHVLKSREAVTHALRSFFFRATVLSLSPTRVSSTTERYPAPQEEDDQVLTAEALQSAWEAVGSNWTEALVVRMLPNPEEKKTQRWSGQNPTYFSREAMEWIVMKGVRHLLVDLPSVDREEDEGQLSNHCLFWDVSPERVALTEETRDKTISEMIFVPDTVQDGPYLLSLQVPPFVLDAAPSRPVLYAPIR